MGAFSVSVTFCYKIFCGKSNAFHANTILTNNSITIHFIIKLATGMGSSKDSDHSFSTIVSLAERNRTSKVSASKNIIFHGNLNFFAKADREFINRVTDCFSYTLNDTLIISRTHIHFNAFTDSLLKIKGFNRTGSIIFIRHSISLSFIYLLYHKMKRKSSRKLLDFFKIKFHFKFT